MPQLQPLCSAALVPNLLPRRDEGLGKPCAVIEASWYIVAPLRIRTRAAGFKIISGDHYTTTAPIVADRLLTRVLRSSDKYFLTQPPVKTEIAKRAFSHAAPAVWNSLPLNCRTANTFSIFKKLMKTHIFKLAYPD